jgi:hypothetical protein
MVKLCAGCQLELTLDMFGKNQSRPDGLQAYCKKCRHKKRKPYQKQRYDRQGLVNYIRNKYLCCFGCDVHPACIQFHHIVPEDKSGSITQISGKENTIQEALKCITVCANCHTLIHHGIIECPSISNIDEQDIRTYILSHEKHKQWKAPILHKRKIYGRKNRTHKRIGRQLWFDFDKPNPNKPITITKIRIVDGKQVTKQIHTTFGEYFTPG